MPFSQFRTGTKGKGPSPFFIATTSGSGRPHSNYVISMIEASNYLGANDVHFDYWLHCENCHVDDARNHVVAEFMRSGAKSLIFIDDDVGFDIEDLLKLMF